MGKKYSYNGPVKLPRVIRLTEKKLGRELAVGQVEYGTIPHVMVDPRQVSSERLDTVIHEVVHVIFPDMEEDLVIKVSNRLASVVWGDGWRRIHP